MIWCYPPSNNLVEDDGYNCFFIGVHQGAYLTDYNLTIPLLLKLNINVAFFGDGFAEAEQCNSPHYKAYTESPLRAICEVLIMIAMEEKQ
jgi:hypothetical protein